MPDITTPDFRNVSEKQMNLPMTKQRLQDVTYPNRHLQQLFCDDWLFFSLKAFALLRNQLVAILVP